jgi:hypothetical protein
MVKLYKHVDNEILYWETWNIKGEDKAFVHWGTLGDKGDDIEIKSEPSATFNDQIEKEIDRKLLEGFKKIDIDDHFTLIIEFKVDGMGVVEDLEKRYRLEDRMDETLGWTGLGKCDGGSMGSGTMEICCYVVDFNVAKRVIEQDLKDTEFADYTRIYDENE